MKTKNCYTPIYTGDIIPQYYLARQWYEPWQFETPPYPWGYPTNYSYSLGEVNNDYHITDNEKEYSIEFNVPGVNKNDIEITLEDSILTVKYEKTITDDKRYFEKTSFKSSFTLPEGCILDTISTKMENGILLVRMDKVKMVSEEPKVKRIEIN